MGSGVSDGNDLLKLAAEHLDAEFARLEREKYRRTFLRLKAAFFKEHPQHASHLFAMYQDLAKKIIAAAEAQGPAAVARIKADLLETLIKVTHRHMAQKTPATAEAVKNMIAVLLRHARALGVPVPQGRFIPIRRGP